MPHTRRTTAIPDELTATLRWHGYPIDWVQLAISLHDRRPLPPRPAMYDPSALHTLYRRDRDLARAVMRHAGGWSQHPHNDGDFLDTLDAWWAGSHADPADPEEPEGHFVAADRANCGTGSCAVTVAHCKDCGLPVYTVGLAHRIDHDEDAAMGWRAIWPAHVTTREPQPEPQEIA